MISVALVEKICHEYVIGLPTQIKLIPGGLHHTWYMKTTKGEFALKWMNFANAHLLNHNLLSPQQSQEIALFMSENDIPTVPALEIFDRFFLALQDKLFLVFPWIKGEVVPSRKISTDMAKIIGTILGKIHTLALNSENLQKNLVVPSWEGFSKKHWSQLVASLKKSHPEISEKINTQLTCLSNWSKNAKRVRNHLNENTLISHRDFDPKNVVWYNDTTPILLDWEYAGLINPELDLLTVALNWSDVLTGKISTSKFTAVLEGYGREVTFTEETFYGYVGYCLDWLEFNLQRLAKDVSDAQELKQEIETSLVALHAVECFFTSTKAKL